MPTIRREIEIAATLSATAATWPHFIDHVLVGSQKLACDELACLDAVHTGQVTFAPAGDGRTAVTFSVSDDPEGGVARSVLEQHVARDLVVFKEYVERGGHAVGDPTAIEEKALVKDEALHGDRPRHEKISTENDTTFWRHHFPT